MKIRANSGMHALLALLSVSVLSAVVRQVPLIEAVKSGEVQTVKKLLSAHANPNLTAPDGSTALMWAVHRDNPEITNLLIQAGANAKLANRYGVTPMALACTNGDAVIVARLLTAGVDPNIASPEGETALMTAARAGHADAVSTLISHGANVNAKESWRGQTALMWASAEGHTEVVKALLQAGADRTARAKAPPPRINPFADAHVANAAKTSAEGQSPADPEAAKQEASADKGSEKGTEKPKDSAGGRKRSNASDFTPLLFAVREGHIEAVRTLLDAGASPNEALADGETALHLAAMNANYEIGLLLLDRGAQPNADKCGWTPLHQVAWTRRPNIHKTPAAIGNGNVESLAFTKRLLFYGANINARETKEPTDGNLGKLKRPGATAFLLAAKSGDYEYMRFLAAQHADTRLMTNEHITPLEVAAGIGIYRVAESPGSNEDAFECVKAAYELAKGDPEYVNHIDDNGRTALHGAAFRGSPEITQYLYDRGAAATINRKDFLGWSALTIAEGVMWPVVLKTELKTAELLVKLGAKHEDVPDEVRMLGMATQGVDNGLDRTIGGGGFFEAPPPAKADVAKADPAPAPSGKPQ
jgi:ankyrin repeat protein